MTEHGWGAQAAREDALRLVRLAGSYYDMADVAQSAEAYGHAVRLAEACGDSALALSARRWWGAAMFEAGHLRQALSALAPIFALNPGEGIDELYVALVKYVETAQLIPIKLKSIESAHSRLESFLADIGEEHWRHMTLRLRSDLAYFRGHNREALEFAEMAWHLAAAPSAVEGPRFLTDEYLSCLVRAQLAQGDDSAANATLQNWQNEEDEIPSYREIVLNVRRSEWCRRVGQLDAAVNYARNALIAAETANHHHGLVAAGTALTRGLIRVSNYELAEETLSRLDERAGSESDIYRYQIGSLAVRLNLGVLRKYRPPATDAGDGDLSSVEYSRLLGHCEKLVEIARAVDERFECDVWLAHAHARMRAVKNAGRD